MGDRRRRMSSAAAAPPPARSRRCAVRGTSQMSVRHGAAAAMHVALTVERKASGVVVWCNEAPRRRRDAGLDTHHHRRAADARRVLVRGRGRPSARPGCRCRWPAVGAKAGTNPRVGTMSSGAGSAPQTCRRTAPSRRRPRGRRRRPRPRSQPTTPRQVGDRCVPRKTASTASTAAFVERPPGRRNRQGDRWSSRASAGRSSTRALHQRQGRLPTLVDALGARRSARRQSEAYAAQVHGGGGHPALAAGTL